LKSRSPSQPILFDDVAKAVKQSFGRDMNQLIFGQILSIVPEFYKIGWQNNKLTVDTQDDLVSSCLLRKEQIKNKLTAFAIQAYNKHCQ
jgi:hypothetical protein